MLRIRILKPGKHTEPSNPVHVVFANILYTLFLLLLTFTINVYSLNPGVSIDKYIHRYWSSLDGLPQNSVTCFCQDFNGFMWIGTENGLARFDGTNFKIYNQIDTPELYNNKITALHTSSDGVLWIGTDGGGITLFKENRFKHFSTKQGLPSPFIRSIFRDNHGNTIILSNNGTISGFKLLKGNLIIPAKIDINTLQKKIRSKKRYITTLTKNSSDDTVYALLKKERDITWIGRDSGLYRIRGTGRNKPEKITGIETLNDNTAVISLYRDRSGGLWIGTRGKGMIYLRDGKFPFYTTADGLSHNSITAIYQDSSQTFWIGTNGGGLNRFKYGKFKTYNKKYGLNSDYITSICRDNRGSLWVGTKRGLNRLENGWFHSYTKRDGFAANSINVLFIDSKGNLWIGTDNGISGFKHERFFTPTNSKELNNLSIISIAEYKENNLLLGTDRGLYALQYLQSGSLIKKISSKYKVMDIYIDITNKIWLGTANHGLIRFLENEKEFRYYPIKSPFSLTCIYRIFEDNNKNLWASSNHGLFVVSKDSYIWRPRGFFRRRPKSLNCYHLLQSEGLISSTFSGGFQPAGWQAESGEIWFPTVKGITVIQPENIKLKVPFVPVVIEKISAAGKTYKFKKFLKFPRNAGKIKIDFSALNFRGFENLKFKGQIISYFRRNFGNQTKISSENTITFTDIPPGKYEFSLSSGNEDQGWSRTNSFYFTVDYSLSGFELLIFFFIIIFPISLVVISKIIKNKSREKEMQKIFKEDIRYRTHFFERKKTKKYIQQLHTIMEEEKPYRDPNMSISKLAKRLGVSKEHISQIINQKFYMNFNQYLNKYRIEEAKERLKDPKENQYVVLKIAHDVGFNSKSTFNTAFKKFTGISPRQYRDKYMKKKDTES